MKKKAVSLLSTLFKVSVALGLLIYLFTSGRLNWQSLATLLSPLVIITGLLCVGTTLLFASERWRILLIQQGLGTSKFHAFKLTLIGTFFNFFVPGGVGGDVIKAVLIARDYPQKRGPSVLTVLVDRILGLFTMTFLALVSFAFAPQLLTQEPSFQFIFAALFVLFLGFLFTFWLLLAKSASGIRQIFDELTQKVPKIHRLWLAAKTYRFTADEVLHLSFFSLGSQLIQIVLFTAVASRLVPVLPPLSVFFFAVPVGFMVTAVPLAPAGIGIGQAAFLFLFSKAWGTETSIGVVGITALQAFQLLYGLAGAYFFVLLKKENPQMTIQSLEISAQQAEGKL